MDFRSILDPQLGVNFEIIDFLKSKNQSKIGVRISRTNMNINENSTLKFYIRLVFSPIPDSDRRGLSIRDECIIYSIITVTLASSVFSVYIYIIF